MVLLILKEEDEEFIGYIKFSPSYALKNGIIIQMTELVSEEQGQGIATDAYKYLLEHFDHIISDEQLTDGSTALYHKLSKKYKPQILIKGNVHSKEKSEQKDELKDIDFTNEKAMKGYENRKDVLFVLSKR
jgi:predicted metal-dependent hydrolase